MSTPSAIALVDLDDTLFQTRLKCPPQLGDDALTPFAVDREGEPLSYATPEQAGFIAWLSATTLLIPVTGRSVDALRRTRLRFGRAVAAHGGVVLTEAGEPCPDWRASMAAEAEAARATLAALRDAIDTRADGRVRTRILAEDGVDLYLVAKLVDPADDEAHLHEVCAPVLAARPETWTAHVNGNNVALLPPFLGKARAVAALLPALRAAHPGLPVLGIGDSLTDAPFMALCDFAMTPAGSQLWRAWEAAA